MGWPVYTERFLQAYGAPMTATMTVPAGQRAVVKSILMSAVAAGAQVNLELGPHTAILYSFQASQLAVVLPVTVAVYAGELIRASTAVASTWVTVGGFMFDDPSGRTGPPAVVLEEKRAFVSPLPSAA